MPLNGRRFNKLVQVGQGKYVQERIIQMKARNNSCDAFSTILSNPIIFMELLFEKLELYGHLVQVVPYPTISEVSEI